MFTPLGLFKDIPCPQGQNCTLLTCIFSHNIIVSSASDDQTTTSENENTITPGDTAIPSKPAAKRIKLEAPAESNRERTKETPLTNGGKKEDKTPQPPTRTSADVVSQKSQKASEGVVKLQSTSKEVSPPPPRAKETRTEEKGEPNPSTNHPQQLLPRNAPKESLNPRMLPKAPASHAVRSSILTKLHAAMSAQNDKVAKEKGRERYLVLSPDELVTMALDEEEKAAKENPSIYANVIKLRVVRFTKMSKEDWLEEVKTHLNSRYYKLKPIQQPKKNEKPFTTGLSAKEEIAIVGKLVTPLNGLEQFGYVTRAPTKEEVEGARKGVTESKGWEKCDRCGGRFQVFPGRREDGSLTSGGQCTYHPARAVYPPRNPTDHITGHREAYFPCCNETIGTSVGCTKVSTHVFKVSETKRLASVLQFEETPPAQSDEKDPRQPVPVCFDCEMGYTTLGMELIRLTAVSWPEGKELLDVLVKPMGEVLDLNSRFSGVFPEHYANAVPYGAGPATTTTNTANPTSNSTSVSEDGEIETEPQRTLQVVDSPSAARDLLFQLLQPDTPLIGHAIDNDLNACRIIHPTIIDTVLLYPHPRGGLPNRMGLKALCRKYLDREIQTGGVRGHDSKEDAIATGDLVRVKGAETWKILKAKGWTMNDGKLVPPPGYREKGSNAVLERSLGPGAGQKRK